MTKTTHLAVDASNHDIVTDELSSYGYRMAKHFEINCGRRDIDRVTGDGAGDTRSCYNEVAAKKAILRTLPREKARYWSKGHPRDHAVFMTKQIGLKRWKVNSGYHLRSLAETAMYRFKQLMGDIHHEQARSA
ncbi:hypothetical protein HG263_05175 [Pseudoalteromonas sp. JBTF-M23]|uniref:DDE family transposase n=1 Tax=Pseudoalteromonas caenipelagi TaxID=2726988 RepID=A0A849VAP8_9GAMM|nr:hypothetical protein [Pseudoalteromonas caenipelagi]NOU49928.1 hypothetical protein [Pseudoalteromonas caenipelagi]